MNGIVSAEAINDIKIMGIGPLVDVQYLANYASNWPRLSYANDGDSGFDLRAAIDKSLMLDGGHTILIPTGVRVAVPAGFELQVRPRSGLALRFGITVLNSPGTVDAGYRGEVGVILINHSGASFKINPGDRIAQGVVSSVARATFNVVAELTDSERGAGGFGSTGVA